MKFLALLVISLQMLVAPVCQAALNCDPDKPGQLMQAGMDDHVGHAMSEDRETSNRDACDEVFPADGARHSQVMSICFDDDVFASAAFNFDPTGNQVSSAHFEENHILSDNHAKPARLQAVLFQDIWLRTLRIRV